MNMRESYQNIDMKKTGILLKEKTEQAGYSVKEIQKILMLSCPQPIYRWFSGKILPSVDHLYVLGHLLHMHIEDLLVPQQASMRIIDLRHQSERRKRLYFYWQCFSKTA